MTVLITRPAPAGQALVEMLRQQNIGAYYTPLISFAPGNELNRLADELAQLDDGDLLFAVSKNAVEYANRQLALQHTSWPENIRYFAIGKTTAQVLEQVSHRPVIYPQGREISEHLIKLSELQNVSGKKVLILRGNGGRELLAESLRSRGATVTFCECYQRQPVAYDGIAICEEWQKNQVNTLLITSNEMLYQLYHLVPENQRLWLTECRLVVVSERIAECASQMGWREIHIADNADNAALLNALRLII